MAGVAADEASNANPSEVMRPSMIGYDRALIRVRLRREPAESIEMTRRLCVHLLIKGTAVLTILLATQACAEVPATQHSTHERVMTEQKTIEDGLRVSQDQAVALAGQAGEEARAANPSAVIGPDDLPLPEGPEISADAFVEAILRMARNFDSAQDMDAANVARVASLGMMPDGSGKRMGIQGAIGNARYEVSVSKSYKRQPGESFELAIRPSSSCVLSVESLYEPLIAAGFGVTRSPPTFKPFLSFERAISDGLGLYVVLSVDEDKEPRCVSRLTLEMEPRDG